MRVKADTSRPVAAKSGAARATGDGAEKASAERLATRKPIPGKRLYEQVAEDLADRIGAGEFAIGDRLASERDLAQSYGVSRPTVREAMIALELEGMVDIRTGSGVYVTASRPRADAPAAGDIGMFELLEARRAFEGESAALAAAQITPDQLAELDELVSEMDRQNARDVEMSEDADRRFHTAIARATKNSAIIAVVEMLWDARLRSAQATRFLEKVRATGVKPRIDEHAAILAALRSRDPEAARAAMRLHLSEVIEAVLHATEVEALERARAEIEAQRKRYVRGG